jgi:hypothetical protein
MARKKKVNAYGIGTLYHEVEALAPLHFRRYRPFSRMRKGKNEFV